MGIRSYRKNLFHAKVDHGATGTETDKKDATIGFKGGVLHVHRRDC